MKIIDSFIFYNELTLLKYRLSVLNDYVDKFVLVEATHTHSGDAKPLYYDINKDMFKEFQDKIVHVVVKDFPFQSHVGDDRSWKNENFHRNCIKRGIDSLSLNPEDLIFTSDLDEIADPGMLMKLRRQELQYDPNNLNRCQLDMYYYNLNTKLKDPWYGLKLISFSAYKMIGLTFQDMRTWEWTHPVNIVPNAGWHFSYFGDAKQIQSKLKNFAHQEFNYDRFTNLESIEKNINAGTDILYRDGFELFHIPIKENTRLPPKYDVYLKEYIKY